MPVSETHTHTHTYIYDCNGVSYELAQLAPPPPMG